MGKEKFYSKRQQLILLGVFFYIFGSWGVVTNTGSLFITSIQETLGVSREAMNYAMSVRSLISVLLSLVINQIYKRIDSVKLMRVTSIVLPLVFFSGFYD